MANIKDLVAAGKKREAAALLKDALFHLMNTVPSIKLTKAEFDAILPALLEKMENPDEVEPEKTPDPGDDVTTRPATGVITVTFAGPDDLVLPYAYRGVYAVGQDFEYVVPEIEGFIPDMSVVRGTMGTEDIHVVVTYTRIPSAVVEDIYGSVRVKKDNTGSAKGVIYGTIATPESVKVRVAGMYVKDQFHQADQEGLTDPEGMTVSAWWPGIVIHAPEDLKKADQAKYDVIKARYYVPTEGKWVDFTLGDLVQSTELSVYATFDEAPPDLSGLEGDARAQKIKEYEDKKAAALSGADKECQSYLWVPITPDELSAPNGPDGFYHYAVQIDWNKDGIYEQTIDIAIDGEAIRLYETADDMAKGEFIWPVI